MMRREGTPIALALAALVACSNTTPAPTASAPPAIAKHGTIVRERFASPALGVDKDVVVYLPAGYDAEPGRRWPVFYYLHGLGGDETNWLKGGALDEQADALGLAAIVVMPDGDDGFYADAADPGVDYERCLADGTGLFVPERAGRRHQCVRHRAYETYIVRDLVAWVDRTYRTVARREGRGLAGLSMGGFGALQLALRHPDLFAAAASHSGVDALLYAGPVPYERGKVQLATDTARWGGSLGPLGAWIRGIFGPDLANWRAHDPAALVATLAPGGPALYLDCGTEDDFALHHGMQYVHDLLLAKGIEHAYYLGPGNHTFAFWRARLPKSLAFLASKVKP